MRTQIIKIYHSFEGSLEGFRDFLVSVAKLLKGAQVRLGVHVAHWQYFYTVDTQDQHVPGFENLFYTHFPKFQLSPDGNNFVWGYKPGQTLVGEITLENQGFFPFKESGDEFVTQIFRSFDSCDIATERAGLIVTLDPISSEKAGFYIQSKISFWWFRVKLALSFFKYWFSLKTEGDWKSKGYKFFEEKLGKELFRTKMSILVSSPNPAVAEAKIRAIFQNFQVFKNYPLNRFGLKIRPVIDTVVAALDRCPSVVLSTDEVSAFFHFPFKVKQETALTKVTSQKLPIPTGLPTLASTRVNGEVFPVDIPQNLNVLGISDFRSNSTPIGIYDEDRLRHIYTIGKTGVGKSKFMISLIIDDLRQGKGIGVIDPHGDLIEDIMMHIPQERIKDVILFDPTDEDFPFCFNPLDVKETESKQILAKGFIDIFHKFFGANWNSKLEHVLRMVFLGLLEKKDSTLFDVIRLLTDKDFRYTVIEACQDDVVRNFWSHEFASWSQQFNSEAIMPILNKVGQILSIDMIKNIFSSTENKLDFRTMMDQKKILLVKLPKGKLQEEIMGFLGAMFVTKIFQSAMSRQGLKKDGRTPFFLYVDEFQNFATDTFSEILSEARKYGLGLIVAHQFIKQIPIKISESLFGNVGTLVSFRISSEDAIYMKQHFEPFLDAYDLANLSQREFYCKTLVEGQVRDPLSLRAQYTKDVPTDPRYISAIYEASRAAYCRTRLQAKKMVDKEQAEVVQKIEQFAEPLI